MPEILTEENKEVIDRHFALTGRHRTLSDMKINLDFPGESLTSPPIRRSNTAADFDVSLGPCLPVPAERRRERRSSATVNSSSGARRRPETARSERSNARSDHSLSSASYVQVPTLLDKLRRGVTPVLVEGVSLDQMSRASPCSSQSVGLSFNSVPSSPHFGRYSTRKTDTLDAQPIHFETKTQYDQNMVEDFAEITSKEELPRSIPVSNAEFQVAEQGQYAYDGNFASLAPFFSFIVVT